MDEIDGNGTKRETRGRGCWMGEETLRGWVCSGRGMWSRAAEGLANVCVLYVLVAVTWYVAGTVQYSRKEECPKNGGQEGKKLDTRLRLGQAMEDAGPIGPA